MAKKAFVIDDSVTMQNMVSIVLKEMGFEIAVAADGSEALEKAQKDEFDLIVTDINMPNMDGIELIKALRAMDRYKDTPIVVLTTESGDNIKQTGREVGASAWIVKPFNPLTMKTVVSKILGQ